MLQSNPKTYMKTAIASLFFFLFLSPILIAQPTIQDCLGAVPVCQSLYTEASSPSGTGNIGNEIPPGTCTAGEINSIWYVFTANEDGLLGFLITPNNLNDDYDWALFDITDVSCGNLSPSDLVSCNAAGGGGCHGVTGCSSDGTGNNTPGGCAGSGPLNQLVPMQAGNTYTLMVSNWTGSTNGYSLDFSGSTGVGVFDETAPEVASVNMLPQSCNDDMISIEFNEFIQCSSVNNSDFELVGPGGPYTVSVLSTECLSGSEQSKSYELTISPPIQSMGDFTLNISPTASTHLLDLCDNQLADFSFDFIVDIPIAVDINIGRDTSLLCAGDEAILDASDQGFVFVWDDGSMGPTLTVNDEGVYSVTVTNECGTGEDAVEVYVQVQPPTVDFGPDLLFCPNEDITLDADNGIAFYTWADGNSTPTLFVNTTGDYAVTVTNGCGSDEDDISITYIPPLNLELASEYVLCAGDTLSLDLERPFASYQWSDGNTDSFREFTEDGSFTVTVTTQCETYEASFNAIFLVDPTLELGEDLELCPNDTIVLAPGIPGGAYRWQDGSTNDNFQVTNSGTYEVSVTTACNELTDSIYIEYLLPITSNLGRDTFLCPEDYFILDASTEVRADFQWENGHKEDKRIILGPGDYIVTVTSLCETVIDSIIIDECEICDLYLPNIFSPNLDGVNDRFYPQSPCVIEDYQMNIFDRWGNHIFTSTSPDQNMGWNGKIKGETATQGTYIWFIDYIVTENGYPHKRQLQGTITLIR